MIQRNAKFGIALILGLVLGTVGVVYASEHTPEPERLKATYVLDRGDWDELVYVFEVGDTTCVRVGDSLECFCQCSTGVCQVATPPGILLPPENTPTDTPPNGGPTDTPVAPTATPIPPTEVPPTDEPRQPCNRGIGNLSEDCDPGNSSGQGGGGGRPAGEDRDEAGGPPPGKP